MIYANILGEKKNGVGKPGKMQGVLRNEYPKAVSSCRSNICKNVKCDEIDCMKEHVEG